MVDLADLANQSFEGISFHFWVCLFQTFLEWTKYIYIQFRICVESQLICKHDFVWHWFFKVQILELEGVASGLNSQISVSAPGVHPLLEQVRLGRFQTQPLWIMLVSAGVHHLTSLPYHLTCLII